MSFTPVDRPIKRHSIAMDPDHASRRLQRERRLKTRRFMLSFVSRQSENIPEMTASLRPHDETLLRLAFDVAKRSREAGDHPFGSVLADGKGRVLMEQANGYTSE